MADFPTLPFTLLPNTTAKSSEVQGNDQSIINSITDGTKRLAFAEAGGFDITPGGNLNSYKVVYSLADIGSYGPNADIVWPKAKLTTGKVFTLFSISGNTVSGSTFNFRLRDVGGSVIWESIGNPFISSISTLGEYFIIDMSTGNSTNIDLTTTDVLGINALTLSTPGQVQILK
jgi:hypothetical protein